MIYNNLIYFLVVLVVLSVGSSVQEPWLPSYLAFPLLVLWFSAFSWLAKKRYRAVLYAGLSSAYFATEKKLTALATAFFLAAWFLLDLKYYLQPLESILPVFAALTGLLLFFILLSLIWLQALPVYRLLFHSSSSARAFLSRNIRSNLVIVLPWLLFTLILDLIETLEIPLLQALLQSNWGHFLLLFIMALLFPPLLWRLWNCVPVEEGSLHRQIKDFFQRHNFSAQLLYWPLFEGKVLTAAVMGILPGLRYVLLTPALVALLEKDELEAVLAHEIAHVKKQHLLLYVVLLFSFSLLLTSLAPHLLFFLFNSLCFYEVLSHIPLSLDQVIRLGGVLVLLTLIILYFRFLFAYFMRNFERQADIYVFDAQDNSFALIRAFEKIVAQGRMNRREKNWHHFGVGERIDFLVHCERDHRKIQQHHRKVYVSLALYFLLTWTLAGYLQGRELPELHGPAQVRYAQAVLDQHLRQEPHNAHWLRVQGDFLVEQGMEEQALAVYSKAISLDPKQAEASNNLAWLLLTIDDPKLRNPTKALDLARQSVELNAQGYSLDTLAFALWVNGNEEEALQALIQAAQRDPDNLSYYQAQARKLMIGRVRQEF